MDEWAAALKGRPTRNPRKADFIGLVGRAGLGKGRNQPDHGPPAWPGRPGAAYEGLDPTGGAQGLVPRISPFIR